MPAFVVGFIMPMRRDTTGARSSDAVGGHGTSQCHRLEASPGGFNCMIWPLGGQRAAWRSASWYWVASRLIVWPRDSVSRGASSPITDVIVLVSSDWRHERSVDEIQRHQRRTASMSRHRYTQWLHSLIVLIWYTHDSTACGLDRSTIVSQVASNMMRVLAHLNPVAPQSSLRCQKWKDCVDGWTVCYTRRRLYSLHRVKPTTRCSTQLNSSLSGRINTSVSVPMYHRQIKKTTFNIFHSLICLQFRLGRRWNLVCPEPVQACFEQVGSVNINNTVR